MKFFVTSILAVVAIANMCSGIKVISGNTSQQNCVINCNDNTPTCGRSISSGQCKYYSSACNMVTDNCQTQLYTLVNLRQCDGLQNGQTGYCILGGNNGGGNGFGSGTITITGNGNRRRNRNRRNRNRRNRNRRNNNRSG